MRLIRYVITPHIDGSRTQRGQPLGLNSLATGSYPKTVLVRRRWQIGEEQERKGTRPSCLAMNAAIILTH